MESQVSIAQFWDECRAAIVGLPETPPEAWAFGATPAHANGLLALVLAGTKTATAGSLWDYQATGEAMPQPGELSVILDGDAKPKAVIETTDVRIVPFDQVDADHAHLEGEGDRSLAHWCDVHERFWREYSEDPRGFEPDMPVVCERFRLIYPVSE